jgi:sugar/nucleoside kinase (ribokinase family)
MLGKDNKMKKDIHLCGLGNSLVDLQYKVTEEEFATFDLKRGDMILADGEQQKNILKKLENHSMNECSGGSAANSIIAFSQLGGKAAYFPLLGKDRFGEFYAKEFEELGIISKPVTIENEPTGTCVVLITPDGERTMHTYLGATSNLEAKHLDSDVIKRSEWLYIEGYEFTQEASANAVFEAVKIAKENETKIAVAFSAEFIVNVFKEPLAKVVAEADMIFCNESEAIAYTGAENHEKAFEELTKLVENVVVTLGPLGAIYKYNGTIYNIPTYFDDRLDTTGAGDMFAGTFLYGLLVEKSPERAGHLASYTAGKLIGQFGARINDDMNVLKKELYEKLA